MRPVRAAPLLALLLSLAGAVLPAAAPALPVPAALVPAGVLAADDIEITTSARYTVDPEARRVRVVVDIIAVNRKPNTVTGGGVTRYFYDGVNLGVQPEAKGFRATQDGSTVRVKAANRKGYRLLTVLFRENLYFGETARVRLAFQLPAGKPRSESDVRVGSAFATFTAWAFGDSGRVRVEVPGEFRVDIGGQAMDAEPGSDGFQVWTARTEDPFDWYAWITATNDAALTHERLALDDGEEIVIRAWPEDARWRTRVRALLRDGVPRLVERIGLPWPVEGSLEVTEVHTPLLEGYAGFYDPKTDRITITEDLDDLTIIHEASHAWFNGGLFTGRWITEGLADEYAARVLRAGDRGYPGPDRVTRKDDAAFALNAWPPPAAIRDDDAQAREAFGYAASWTLMRRIVARVGEAGMREVFAAAAAGTTAYPGERQPERSRLPNDWRRLLDLTEQLAGAPPPEGDERSIAELVATWALEPDEAAMLPARADAREAYAALVAEGDGWAAPALVRLGLDAWHFADATDSMAAATTVLATRDELTGLADAEGLTPDPGLEDAYQDAESVSELAAVDGRATRSLEVLEAIAGAADAVAAPRDWLASWGLEGTDPAAALASAGAAWEAGDLDAAAGATAEVLAILDGAPATGRTKAIVAGLAIVGVLLVLLAIVVLLGRRRGGGRRVPSTVVASAAGPPEAAGPYATLPPDGRPAVPPGWPPSPDEGADRS